MTATSDERALPLASEPLRAAGPVQGFLGGTGESLRQLAAHSQLLRLLVQRELKARYKDSALGFFWSLARPLTLLAVYYVAIGMFLGAARNPRNPHGIPDFAIFIFAGLTAWQLFSDILTLGTASVVANSALIKKVYVPREVFPLSVVGSSLVNFSIQLAVLVGATLFAGKFPTGARWGYFVLSLAVLVVFSTALALLLSAVNVYLRDVQYLVEILIMILFWASPIVYAWSAVSASLHGFLASVYLANPMTQVALGFQRTFWVAGDTAGFPPTLMTTLAVTLLVSVVLLWFCQRVFARLQSNFAQEL